MSESSEKQDKRFECFFFPNGLVAFLDTSKDPNSENGQQIPDIQKDSWVKIYAEHLKSKGIDPLDVFFNMPSLMRYPLKVDEEGNYRIDWDNGSLISNKKGGVDL